jgi:glucose/mannose-6-phosphate isomerase
VNSILESKGIETIRINASGPNRLAEIFSLVQVGDFVSFYLAILNRTDPSPVKVIDRLKSELEKSG